MKKELITKELLKQWKACSDGYELYCKLFPEGADLETATEGLMAYGQEEWAIWLFRKCMHNNLFKEITCQGFRNEGRYNTGDLNKGFYNSGSYNIGDCNTGDRNTGMSNSGYLNRGFRNAGMNNIGALNTGNENYGCRNAGDGNNGEFNTGKKNNGHKNSGNMNNGNENTGSWNACDLSTGYFNTKTPDEILVFNKPCSHKLLENAYFPSFLFRINLNCTGFSSEMTDKEKKEDSEHFNRVTYKEAFKKAWDEADPQDRIKVKELPNFDADVFFEITGIDLRN